MKRSYLKRKSTHPANVKLRKAKKRAITITKLKAQLWSLIRQIIINRYGNTCYTCGAIGLSGSNLHIGHFIPSSLCSMELRYSLDNLRPQCYRDNIHLSGNWPAYKKHLMDECGTDFPEWLERQNELTKGQLYGRFWVEQKIKEMTALLAEETV